MTKNIFKKRYSLKDSQLDEENVTVVV